MAYSVEYLHPQCERCINIAKKRVFRKTGDLVGFFCMQHAKEEVHRLNEEARLQLHESA